ncbi:MAG: ABC transporter ATP-binding protein, partial [Ruminococcus sp.]|nr:ABC transporter ATP-binding protein [Ruminococcus sp.]
MIVVKDIVKTYGNHKAVDHLSFSLEKGKVYGFLGPNGAGKSTTMNIMTGYIAANEGTVIISGHDIVRQPEEAKKCIGYLPELPPLYSDMTVREYLQFVAELKKVPRKERRDQIAKILSMTMLGDYKDRMIRNLSKGYKQRVGLAQALIGFPEVIILDEPTVGLDPQQIIEIRNLIRTLKEDHIVILSSHILSEVNEVCDYVMIISHGKLLEEGAPDELEKKFSGKEHIKMSILGTEPQIKGALAGIPNLSDITISGEKDSQGGILVEVINNGKDDIRADIARAL